MRPIAELIARHVISACSAVGAIALLLSGSVAEGRPAATHPSPAQPPSPQQTAQQAAVTQANADLILTLVRTSLIAVQQADATNNYSVLRQLGSPSFQEANNVDRLSATFAGIRQSSMDLSGAVLLLPQLSNAELTNAAMLHVSGTFATKPVPVRFEILFQPIQGHWTIDGILIAPAAVTP